MLLGSFAETLIMHSDVPVMVSGPVQKNGGRLDHILFPTDLCDFTTPMLRHAIALAQQLKAKLTLFHAIPNPVEPILQSGMFLLGGSWVPVHTYFARDLEHRKRRLETMVKMARKAGVSADFYVHEASGSISGAILDYTKKHKVGMVIMAAQSGPVTANLIGSIARQVVRHTICPVWIIHAAHLKASHLKISKQAPRQYRQAA
jgi:nucleotide-binding universal stress UspA family protein